jgi:hypothetical protein
MSEVRLRSVLAAGRGLILSLVTLSALLTVGCGISASDAQSTTTPPPTAAAAKTVSIGGLSAARPIGSGFVGLSIEFRTLLDYAGSDPSAVNPVFVQLLRNLAPGQPAQLRIGGDTTDWTWYPYGSRKAPAGVRYSVTSRWLGVASALTQALNAQTIIGVNLETNNPGLASVEARAFVRALGQQRIEGLEIGNEPELYGSFAWYVLRGVKHFGRPHSYGFNDFLDDYAATARALPAAPLAGPNTGGTHWMPILNQFLGTEHGIHVATLHRYPLKRCTKSAHVTIGQLLSESSARGLADSVAGYAAISHRHGIPLRIDEINSVSCGGAPGVSDTYATALWAVDAMFQMARVGVDGVNVHSRPGVTNELFSFRNVKGRWSATVNPVYYGLMMFADAAPAGSRLLRVSGPAYPGLNIWGTRAPDGRIRVALINKDARHGRTVALQIAGANGPALVARLRGPRLTAKRGVTFDGQGFGTNTSTGTLTGAAATETIAPNGSRYVVQVPAASAALLTIGALK